MTDASQFDRRILARIARQGGAKLLNAAVDRFLPVREPAPAGQSDAPKKSGSIAGKLIGAAAVRVATRSIPGAIVVGGGLLAKARYDKRRAKKVDSAPKDPPKA